MCTPGFHGNKPTPLRPNNAGSINDSPMCSSIAFPRARAHARPRTHLLRALRRRTESGLSFASHFEQIKRLFAGVDLVCFRSSPSVFGSFNVFVTTVTEQVVQQNAKIYL